jgi:hypothetical protein
MNTMNCGKRKFDGSNKREWRRLNPSEVPSLKGVMINQGADAQVIDISMGGILLETEFRLRPQMKIVLKVVTTKGVLKIDGYVLRSSIKSIAKTPLYRSAIVFDQPLSMLEDLEQKQEEQSSEMPSQSMMPDIFESEFATKSDLGASDQDLETSPTILTVMAPEKFGATLDDMFSLNDW